MIIFQVKVCHSWMQKPPKTFCSSLINADPLGYYIQGSHIPLCLPLLGGKSYVVTIISEEMAMTHHICTTGLPSPTWDFLLSRNDSGWQGPHLVAHVWAVGGQSKCADQLEAKFTILFLRSSLMFWITNSLRLIFSKLVCQFEMGTFAEYINMVQAFNYSKQNCVWLDNFPLGHIISSVWDNVYDMTVMLHMEMHYNKKKHEVPFKSAKCAFSKDKHWQKTYILVHIAVYFCQEQHTQAETCWFRKQF